MTYSYDRRVASSPWKAAPLSPADVKEKADLYWSPRQEAYDPTMMGNSSARTLAPVIYRDFIFDYATNFYFSTWNRKQAATITSAIKATNHPHADNAARKVAQAVFYAGSGSSQPSYYWDMRYSGRLQDLSRYVPELQKEGMTEAAEMVKEYIKNVEKSRVVTEKMVERAVIDGLKKLGIDDDLIGSVDDSYNRRIAAGPTDLNQYALFVEVLRQGPILTEFSPENIPHIRRCIAGELLESTGIKHGKGFKWRLTPAGETAVWGQHKKALDGWERSIDSWTKVLDRMPMGPGQKPYAIKHEGFDLHWEVEPVTRVRSDQARESGMDWYADYVEPMEAAALQHIAKHRNVLFEPSALAVSTDSKGHLHVEVTEEAKRKMGPYGFGSLQQLLDFRL